MTDYAALVPVNVVTGFLGAGKTTLLGELLASDKLRDTAVLVNELGEVGLDHHLLQPVAESTLLLENGCVCCAIRGDLKDAVRDLHSRRERGEIPAFRRVVIETSGLADPVPIAYTVLAEPVLQHHYRLGNVVTVVDAVNGAASLDRHPESVKQAGVADRIVLAKTDLAEPAAIASLRGRLAMLNRAAPVTERPDDSLDPDALLLDDAHDPHRKARAVHRWLEADDGAGDAPPHRQGIFSVSLRFDRPLDWTAFGIWMTMLLHHHGDRVLRIKGMLHVDGLAAPVLVNGVQHVVHPPTHLDAWPDADRSSRLVIVAEGLDRVRLERSLTAFNRLANPA